ncbi:AcrR family transcriptional regulator [Enterococcus sp. PF1-24]|uniref:TetR/AcrR family transcriptional regulator n=1 Tax=unclassified Enterococcus TaxID=2608891 RepID=UPI0024748826|nr:MULTISPECIES: TetR/AcrR family transcriptional regulator [unclassified Enterococcus]MDH6364332.1 AcrR family transcriptional regulator [Enterococcus sp. PFB1-1]MDH6401479.1 AcrR family transcriptional regulator [Enterococcus sp. PF1-24]
MDRRVRKTQSAIKTAFLQLLKTKEVKAIKVSEICSLADINRGTFYLNYLDKYDLLEKIISESIERLIAECSATTNTPQDSLNQTFQLIIENKANYRTLIFADKEGFFAKYLTQHILTLTATEDLRDSAEAIFIANGIVGVLNYYLASERSSEAVLYEIESIVEKFRGGD